MLKINESIDILNQNGYNVYKLVNQNKYCVFNKFMKGTLFTRELCEMAAFVEQEVISKLIAE